MGFFIAAVILGVLTGVLIEKDKRDLMDCDRNPSKQICLNADQ
jgi:hypothetical protein